jgi:hypothetical protein
MFGAALPPVQETTFRRRVSTGRRYAQAMTYSSGMAMGFLLMMGLTASAQTGVIGVIQDFESGFRPGASPCDGIAITTSSETDFGQTCLQVHVAPGFAWRWKGWSGRQDGPLDAARLALLSGPYLPPEADAVRLRVRIASGRALLTVGGPVSQIGPSDVFCDPQLVDARDGTDWRTVEISLNHRIARNFRRPNFTADLPVVYYTRWAQEPLHLYFAALPPELRPAEETVVFVDQVELVARGEGRPFPHFDPEQIHVLQTLADFESASALTNVFSVGHGYSIIKSFVSRHQQPQQPLPYPAPLYSLVEGRHASKALQAECTWAEEGQIATLKTRVPAGANALAFTLKPSFPAKLAAPYALEYGGRRAHAVDFVVFVAPPGKPFPWAAFEAHPDLQRALRESGQPDTAPAYHYLLATGRQAQGVAAADVEQAGAFGFYTARRYVTADEWSSVVIPLADFVCVYGQGACREPQAKQMPLQADAIAAIGFLAPFGSGRGTLALDDLACARVPGAPDQLRSFWQVPDLSRARLIALPRFHQYGTWSIMTAGEDAPAYLR